MAASVLVVATRNPGKMREYRELLADWPVELISLDDAGVSGDVDETGDTFRANACLKAGEYARLSNLPTISDDSGLEAHALGGDPGVYSARYGGDACQSDADRSPCCSAISAVCRGNGASPGSAASPPSPLRAARLSARSSAPSPE